MVETFVVELLEDAEINEAHYPKGRRFSFDNRIPDHIQEVIDAGKAKVVTDEAPEELPKEPEAPASSPSSDAGEPAAPSEPEVPAATPVEPGAVAPSGVPTPPQE